MSEPVPQIVHIVCEEAKAFDASHPELRDSPARSLGMLAWGLLRAVAECPHCPGVFRTSPDDWHTLVCPQCRGVWTYQPQEARRRRRRRTREGEG